MRKRSLLHLRSRKGFHAVSALAFLAALASVLPDAHGACDPLTWTTADNCASLQTSLTGGDIDLYADAGPAAAISFSDNTCTPPCALDNSATALHGTVTNSADGTFTYAFNDNNYSGPETITYTRADNTTATIDVTVCAVAPCTISNPTAQIGTYVFTDNALVYTPDVTVFGQPLTDNLAYVVTDKNGQSTTIRLAYVYPTFSTSGTTVTFSNHAALNVPFRQVEQGASYNVAPYGAAWFVGDNGRGGGAANSLVMINDNSITTTGDNRSGIEARSLGGNGQGGENGGTRTIFFLNFYGEGGDGGWGGSGGTVIVNNAGDIATSGARSHGIWAQSRGGDGGWGGNARGAGSNAGSGSPGGPGGKVEVRNFGDITTHGNESDGIRAESLSGTGGRGGNAGGWFTNGGNGSFGVPSGPVLVDSTGDISTDGFLSHGIFAQSIGGGGGNGGNADGWFTGDAGDGGGAGNGGTVEVNNTGSITTSGNASDAIFAQSVGGGGGGGGNGSGWFAVGGSGVAAGDGNPVTVSSAGGAIATGGSYSNGIFAQSVGGGGGGGGSATAVGAFFSFGLGGNGGDGGAGKTVAVRNDSAIHTSGENSYGILAQSVGGGGGSGGYSIAASAGAGFSGSLSIGGTGAKGGDAGAVSVINTGAVWTDNTDSHGIFAQSVGGSGGNGGFAIAAAISDGVSLSLSFGGSGGSGGISGPVNVSDTGGSIRTLGDGSYGILAQSVGGGGGSGGFSIAGGISGGASLNFSMAGTGGAGGRSNTVSVSSGSDIATGGDDSHAIFAQSVGGGGGAGGFSVTGGVSGGATIGASVGGDGGSGGTADNVTVSATVGTIHTSGNRSYGILAQSVGGGGGDGGFSVAGGLGGSTSVNFAMGGKGGVGGGAGTVSVGSASDITTDNNSSHAIFAQSVGGGGGSGGFSVTGGISGGAAIGAAIGGAGGGGGTAGNVTVVTADNTALQTFGERSYGILAQSIGGCGGDGGFSVAGGISNSAAVNFAMGGGGGAGGTAGAVSVDSASSIATLDNNSHGIFAQSVGGGGGSGGFSVTAGISSSAAIGASIGGSGGAGARADNVTVRATGASISTSGDRSYGILAQSVGGTGGDGGFSVAAGISNSAAVNFSLGGSGGSGGSAGAVSVGSVGDIVTRGSGSHAVFAQSLGGGGGSGGFSVSGGISASSAAVGASIGGSGGVGATAGSVGVTTRDNTTIQTSGDRSYGILAQSVGGTGGDGGFSVAGGISKGPAVNFSMGGGGGDGGSAGVVNVLNGSDITTFDNNSHAIFAQSVGGGGGSGGFSVTGGISADSAAVGASIGGFGGDGARADNVTVRSTGTVLQTSGDRSYGILAQSMGGTGGDGGFSVAGGISKSASVSFSMGGFGGDGAAAGAVSVDSASAIATLDNASHGIFAQSVGGGGGSGGFSVAGSISVDSAGVGASIGGSGGDGARADKVRVNSTGATISTSGERSYGILAQSIGGSGGDGGFSVAGAISKSKAVTFSLGGGGGTGSLGGNVELASSSSVSTLGRDSHALFAQSLGGSGGSGGFSVAGSISADNSAVAGVGISIGGFGGGGGNAGRVTVSSTGDNVATFGERSYGILAQSVGGGGGDGGFSVAGVASKGRAISFSMGGGGGTAGSGGTVSLGNASSIATHDTNSHGIFAQSVGGGGGSGGFSVAGSVSADNSALAAVGISIGGFGGGGGNADNVSVDSTGKAIFTEGDRSYGILAQSVGGGGGDGGFSVAGGIGKGGGATFSLGGSGAAGGQGRAVDLRNSSDIATLGDGSHALFAQSLGGGGGSGGFSVAGSISWDNAAASIGVSVGGFGGAGRSGDRVTVATRGGSIFTAGDGANGILAQSIGGGGGNGGFSVAGSFAKGNNSKTLSVSVGGFGGDGGNGGVVDVENAAAIATLGDRSEGIFAQSVGGGGGSGGFSVTGSWGGRGSKDVSLALGGFGGDGNYADNVSVGNTGTIDTAGIQSHGIFAQSVGGGGGKGGWSAAVALGSGGDNTAGTDNTSRKVDVGVRIGGAVGGFGGDGSYGGSVVVTNDNGIVTRGSDAFGILAQSVGGAGGKGGNAFSGVVTTGANDNGTNVNFSAAVGGWGGDGNHGGPVSVSNDGSIDTSGAGSHGIFAQSVGGGGGDGGRANSLSLVLGKKKDSQDGNETKDDGSKNNWNFSVAVGGFGGGASDGRAVTVSNSGGIITRGTGSKGIFAQSIGGGGGNGGNGILGKDELLPDLPVDPETVLTQGSESKVKWIKDWQVSVGGQGGSSGNGGEVTVGNTGNIVTLGDSTLLADGTVLIDAETDDGSFGIFAQSIGGGGGTGGDATIGESGKVGIGGGTGSTGNGGAVTVSTSGRIDTFGNGAHAIVAQSGGGGGGIAGNVNRKKIQLTKINEALNLSLPPEINIGLNLAFGQGGGNGGDGGAVTVRSTGDIATRGTGAFGILAQSFGGGGGIAGDPGLLGIHLGSVGGDGSGGAVTVTHTGRIHTTGAASHGIFAQSAGGKDFGGKVDVTIEGDTLATGEDSTGVFAQSRGDKGAGDISIDIVSGVVQGGFGAGSGVLFSNGAANLLTNRGTITTMDGVSGTAIGGNTGNETVHNFGIVAGSVDLGAGSNAFRNEAGATFLPGAKIFLGGGNTFTNDGTLSPGGGGVIQTTALTGGLAQSGSGALLVDLDLKGDKADRIVLNGTADMAGRLTVNLMDPGWIPSGTHRYAILSGADTVADSGLFLVYQPSAVIDYKLSFTGKDLDLAATVDFASVSRGLTGNQAAIGEAINAIQRTGGTEAFAPVVARLVGMTTLKDLASAYDQLSPATYDSYTNTGHEVTRQYTQTFLKRIHSVRMALGTAGGAHDARERERWLLAYRGSDASVGRLLASGPAKRTPRYGMWGDGFGLWGSHDGGGGSAGYDYRSAGAVLGVDTLVSDRFLAGIGLGQSRTNVDLDENRGSGHIDSTFGSLYGSYFTPRMYIDMALSYGSQSYESNRNVVIDNVAGTLLGGHDADVYSAYAEGGYNYHLEKWILQPYAHLQYVTLDEEGFTESGMAGVSLQVAGRTTRSLVSELGARFERVIPTSVGILLPGVSAAWSHDFDLDDRTITSSFTAAPGTSFSVQGREMEPDGAVLGAGVTYLGKTGVSASIKYSGGFRKEYTAQGIYGEFRYEF